MPTNPKGQWTKKGCTSGGFAELYIKAKIELYADGRKGGKYADLIKWAKDRGHNMMANVMEGIGEPTTKEAKKEAEALADFKSSGGSSSTD